MKSKFLTMVVYSSGRKELFSDKNQKDMAERRKSLSGFPTIQKVSTPSIDELMEVKNEKNSNDKR